MANYKTVPNQKVIEVNKEDCGKQNIYATINIAAMEKAAQDLEAGAFKLWVYFAKNQNGYSFALSSKAVQQEFGIKIKQYNNAIESLVNNGYLVNTKGNNYTFYEIPVNTKGNNGVITKEDNAVITKSNKALLPKDIRNTTDNTIDNITNNTEREMQASPSNEPVGSSHNNPVEVSREWLIEHRNNLSECAGKVYMYNNKFYREEGADAR